VHDFSIRLPPAHSYSANGNPTDGLDRRHHLSVRDDDIRSSCFASLDVLCAKHGPELPYVGGLDAGFAFRGRRVPFLNYQKGIYKAAAQTGPAALSVNTSYKSPYDDQETPDGFMYAYRAGAVDQPDNQALRAAFELQVPIVYFVGTRPGWYRPEWPVFVTSDDPLDHRVTLTPGRMIGPYDEREPVLPESAIERRYVVRETRVRLHQARFRARVLPAYANQCTICRLKETRLLDAAHIVSDADVAGEPSVNNGLSLCSIHHRAFDEDLVGVTPDYEVRVHPRLLDEDDGPMLDLLKGAHEKAIILPRRQVSRPDRELLAQRFDRFAAAV
jgi:putative restriction endonuclease